MKQLVKFVLGPGLLFFAPVAPAAAQTVLWTRQAGTPTYDYGYGVAEDGAGNAYITGTTYGDLGGPSEGSTDFFLAKYDASGNLLWMRQVGTPDSDEGYGVAVDGLGHAYVFGKTYTNFGGPYHGNGDVFLAKFEASGDLLWVRQPGTSAEEFCGGVAVDGAGNASITGLTYGDLGGPSAGGTDIFLARYDASGTLLWMRQAGTPADDFGNGVAVDGENNAYITGSTYGSLGGPNGGMDDIFLAKYDASGTLLWMRQAGTSAFDWGNGVAVDGAGNAFVAGTTGGNLGGPNQGLADAFITKYDTSGTPLWTRQTGTSANDYCSGVAADGVGDAYITGATSGSLGGPNAGGDDIFLAKFDASGDPLWTSQAGTPASDWSYAVAADGAGHSYITGSTTGSLGGPNAGSNDIFLAKYGPPPCYPDLDRNGTLDLFDFLAFVNLFNAADPKADCDGDGALDLFDFLCFTNAFNAGCPL